MESRKESREEKRARWLALVEEKERGGQSAKAFCEERGLSQATFQYWSRRARASGSDRSGGIAEKSDERFVRIGVGVASAACEGSACIEVDLGEGRRVAVRRGFDEETLARVLRVVESARA